MLMASWLLQDPRSFLLPREASCMFKFRLLSNLQAILSADEQLTMAALHPCRHAKYSCAQQSQIGNHFGPDCFIVVMKLPVSPSIGLIRTAAPHLSGGLQHRGSGD